MIDKDLFLSYYNKGYNDTKIAEITSIYRKSIGKMRHSLKLPRMKKYLFYHKIVKNMLNDGYVDREIAKKLNLSRSEIYYIRKIYGYKTDFIHRTYKTRLDKIKGYMIRNIKGSAKRRNLKFDLIWQDIELPEYCPILETKLDYYGNYQNYNHPTIDRIDNSKGYTKGNIITVSRLANIMKNSANFDELELFSKNMQLLINYYKNQGALGSITDIFPNIRKLSLDS